MKLAVKNSEYEVDLTALKAIDSSTVNTGDKKLVDTTLYIYRELALDNGVKPNDKTVNQRGRWVKCNNACEAVYVVEDNYDFVTNQATDLTSNNTDIVLNFAAFGVELVGSATNFKDWMCLRDSIKAGIEGLGGADYATYATLSAEIRAIASTYVPSKVIDNVSFNQLVVDCGGSVAKASESVDTYIILSSEARKLRYAQLVSYAYLKLGKTDGLKAEDKVLKDNLKRKYVVRGVRKLSEDAVDGLVDWLDATDTYTTDGLKKLLQDAVLTIKDATSITDFINTCKGIVENGQY